MTLMDAINKAVKEAAARGIHLVVWMLHEPTGYRMVAYAATPRPIALRVVQRTWRDHDIERLNHPEELRYQLYDLWSKLCPKD